MGNSKLLFPILLAAAMGCSGDDFIGNEGFEIDCDGEPCDWVVVEGDPQFDASWHPSDPGADLSAPGRIVIEQRAAPFELDERELILAAAIVRDPSASLRFELEWYVDGESEGATYWDRDPIALESRSFDVTQRGVFALEELVSTPSLEATGVVVRVVKDGTGRLILDELFLSKPVYLP